MAKIYLGWKKKSVDLYINAEWKRSPLYRGHVLGSEHKPYIYADDGHLITFAPTGSGKGVACVIPTLLSYSGSVVVLDPKGENYAVTAKYRSDTLGHKVYAFDPYDVIKGWRGKSHKSNAISINPFDLIGDGRDSPGARARAMADALIPTTTDMGEEKFWAVAAQNLLAGLIAHTIEESRIKKRDKNLIFVAEIIADDVLEYVLKALAENDEAIEENAPPTLSSFTQIAFSNFVNIGAADKARDSVIFSLNTYIENLLTREISSSLRKTSLDLSNLRSLRNPYALYIVIPPEKLQSDANVLRLIITSVLKVIISRRRNEETKELVILDECAQLGEMKELRQIVTLLRGYGVLAWMFFQDLSQLQTTYKDWKSFVNNCGVVQVFGYDRQQPADEISALLGSISPDDVMRLGNRRQLVSIRGERTTILKKNNYLSDAFFKERSQNNPYYKNGLH